MFIKDSIEVRQQGAESNSGFSLLGAAVFTVMLGLLSSAVAYQYNISVFQEKRQVTEVRMAAIKEAIEIFVRKNNHLPCVAPYTAQIDSAQYATETDCSLPAVGGTFSANGRAGLDVRIGAVPVRTLNLPKDHMTDGWGRRFTLAVTSDMATTVVNYANNEGAIDVIDGAGTSLTTPAETAMYVLIGHGADGRGAYAGEGGLYLSCVSSNGLDRENCDADSDFRGDLSLSTSDDANHYDDYIFYSTKAEFPSAAINRYELDIMECDEPSVHPVTGVQLAPDNPYGENCATAFVSGIETGIGAGNPPSNGILLYSKTYSAENTGQVSVRATIPMRYDNNLAVGSIPWATAEPTRIGNHERAFQAAIYVDNNLVVIGDLLNPESLVYDTSGGTGLVMGSAPIVENVDYTIDIYLFCLHPGNDHVTSKSAWAGTINVDDYAVKGVVEIMESGVQ